MTVTEIRNDLATDAANDIEVETIDPNAPREVTFDADRIPRFMEELARLNKIAKKLDVAPIAHKVTGTGTRTETEDGYEFEVETITVELTGASPRLPGGWAYLGAIEHTGKGAGAEDGNLVHGDDDRLAAYREAKATCDHCRTDRYRRKTVVLESEAGELVRVGSTCLKDFLGYHGNPERFLRFFEDIASTVRDLEDEDGGERFARPEAASSTLHFLATAAAAIRVKGWVAKSAYSGTPTATWVEEKLYGAWSKDKDHLEELAEIEVTDRDEAKAAAVRAWTMTLDPTNNYLGNLRVALGGSYVAGKHTGLAVSAVSTYDREMGFAAEREAKAAGVVSEHVGTLGKRETFTLEVTRIHVYETNYGTSRIVVFKDEAGNTVKTFTSGAWAYRAEVGDKLVAKATTKEHGEFKGAKETVLSRLAVVRWIEEEEG